jgi:hypothetical protein
MSMVEQTLHLSGPCWVRHRGTRDVRYVPYGSYVWGEAYDQLPALGLRVVPLARKAAGKVVLPREEYNQKVWDLYRAEPEHRSFLLQAGLAGPDDFEAALGSAFIIIEGDGTEDDPPVYLNEYVLHTVTAYSAHLPFELAPEDR